MKRFKILLGIIILLLVIGFVMATYRREIYDYQGSWLREKINYSLISATNFSGTRADFADGWLNGGLSIINGDIFAQTGYFYNLTSLNVTKQNLTILEDAYFNGNVGIGTTSPLTPLDVHVVAATTPLGLRATRFAAPSQYIQMDTTGANQRIYSTGIGKGLMFILHSTSAGTGTTSDSILFQVPSVTPGDLVKAITIQSKTGNVGIGTTTPQNMLNVIGDGNFTGNLYVTGNVTAENVFLPAYISVHTNDTIPVTSSGEWVNVTFDNEIASLKERINHTYNDSTNYTFTIQDTGVYEVSYTLTFEDSAASPNAHIVSRVTKNNVELNGFTIERDSSKQYHDFGLYHSDLINLVSGDKIIFSFTSDDLTVSLGTHLTYGEHKNTAHATIRRVA